MSGRAVVVRLRVGDRDRFDRIGPSRRPDRPGRFEDRQRSPLVRASASRSKRAPASIGRQSHFRLPAGRRRLAGSGWSSGPGDGRLRRGLVGLDPDAGPSGIGTQLDQVGRHAARVGRRDRGGHRLDDTPGGAAPGVETTIAVIGPPAPVAATSAASYASLVPAGRREDPQRAVLERRLDDRSADPGPGRSAALCGAPRRAGSRPPRGQRPVWRRCRSGRHGRYGSGGSPLYSSRAPREPPTTDRACPSASGQRPGARSSRTAVVAAAPTVPAVAVEWNLSRVGGPEGRGQSGYRRVAGPAAAARARSPPAPRTGPSSVTIGQTIDPGWVRLAQCTSSRSAGRAESAASAASSTATPAQPGRGRVAAQRVAAVQEVGEQNGGPSYLDAGRRRLRHGLQGRRVVLEESRHDRRSSVHQEAAADVQRGSGDEGGVPAGQEHRDAGDLARARRSGAAGCRRSSAPARRERCRRGACGVFA